MDGQTLQQTIAHIKANYFAPMSVALNQMSFDSSGALSKDMSDDTSLSLA